MAAGPWAVLGACFGAGGQDGLHALLNVTAIVLVGPIMEEVMKAAAAGWAVETRPYWFTSAPAVIICCAAAGLSFSLIENLLYLNVYIADPEPWIAWWRWTVCTALHTGCSTIAGLGLARVWRRTITTGTRPDLSAGTPWLIAAIVLHGLYNALAVALELVHAH
jgi:RsiW-degrading membrane proteinase PrsW (M82 family)